MFDVTGHGVAGTELTTTRSARLTIQLRGFARATSGKILFSPRAGRLEWLLTMELYPVRKAPIVLSLFTLLVQTQIHADPPVTDATACDAMKVDARNVVLWVLCHNQVDARQDKNESPYLIEVWLGYRSGRLYLAEQFHDGKISEEDFRKKLELIDKQAFDEAERRRQAHAGR